MLELIADGTNIVRGVAPAAWGIKRSKLHLWRYITPLCGSNTHCARRFLEEPLSTDQECKHCLKLEKKIKEVR